MTDEFSQTERYYPDCGLMTDDIVTRLRLSDYKLVNEAADEIERLRSEVDIKGHRVDDLHAEIERLRSMIGTMARMDRPVSLATAVVLALKNEATDAE